jgi:hypothetical protein
VFRAVAALPESDAWARRLEADVAGELGFELTEASTAEPALMECLPNGVAVEPPPNVSFVEATYSLAHGHAIQASICALFET